MSYKKDIILFESLYKEHFAFLSMVSLTITKDQNVAKDIVQDYFLYLWNSDREVVFKRSFKAYSIRAVKNLSLKYVAKASKISVVEPNDFAPILVEPFSLDKGDNIKAKKVLRLLEKLPEARKKIFVSHVINGLSYSEIAENQDISINTVKTQMKRVYAFIRGEMNGSVSIWVIVGYFLNR